MKTQEIATTDLAEFGFRELHVEGAEHYFKLQEVA